MHKLIQGQNAQNLSPWDEAIGDAEKELSEIESRGKQLKVAIANFAANRDAGHPWPGKSGYTVTQKAGTEEKSVPA